MKNTYTETEVKTLFKTFIKDVVGGDFEFGLPATMSTFNKWWNRSKDRALVQELFTKDELKEAFAETWKWPACFCLISLDDDFERWFNSKYKTK